MEKQQHIEQIDLTKVVPISKQQQVKLSGFLDKLCQNLKFESDVDPQLSKILNKWNQQINK